MNRGRDDGCDVTPPSKPDGRISRIRLSSGQVPARVHVAGLAGLAWAKAFREISPSSAQEILG
jgi:hypothetical protein